MVGLWTLLIDIFFLLELTIESAPSFLPTYYETPDIHVEFVQNLIKIYMNNILGIKYIPKGE